MAHQEANDLLVNAAHKMFAAPFNAVLKLTPDEGAALWVDGRQHPPSLSSEAPDSTSPDCQWRGGRDAMIRAMAGARAFESAYASGRVAVSGDMSVMARLVFGENK